MSISRTPMDEMIRKSLNWMDPQDLFPGGSLVSGYHDPDRLNRTKQITELIERMPPRGRLAVRSVTVQGERTVEVLFEMEEAAARLGDALRVRKGVGGPVSYLDRSSELVASLVTKDILWASTTLSTARACGLARFRKGNSA